MTTAQHAQLTFKGNVGVGRHGWLRLTPAYGVTLVRTAVRDLPAGAVVTDPFSGTGTTALAAAEHGGVGQGLDVNPFLVWLGNAKARTYCDADLADARDWSAVVGRHALDVLGQAHLWQPRLFRIDRWWRPGALAALKALRDGLDAVPDVPGRDLLLVGFCRTLIAASNAAFNHQSMSFLDARATQPSEGADAADDADADARETIELFAVETERVLCGAGAPLAGTGRVVRADSRTMAGGGLEPCDLLYTSPPYVNRMSYIRELRPYMYWLGYLDEAADAGELDWRAIGGTWGMATSRLATWSSERVTPVEESLAPVCALIAAADGRSGPLLATYVRKYFLDVWDHVQAAAGHVKPGGRATYVVGNSTFYRHVVPTQQWYAALMAAAGFDHVEVSTLRKRNSKKALYEFAVSARRP